MDAELSLIHCREIATNKTIAAAGFFAVHPTVMGAKTEVYHADLFGIATQIAEQHLQKKEDAQPIVALFNGAEGDISPNWEKRDRRNAMLLGEKLAHGLTHLLDEPQQNIANTDIQYRFENINLVKRCFQLKNIERCTAEKPSVGVATLGGATDGRSRLHSFLWREHVKGTRNEQQGTKQPPNNPLRMELPFIARFVLDSLMGQIVPPKDCPLGVYQLGDIVLATLPGEFTTTQGSRIRQAIAKEIPGKVLTIGLANEYISYFTTPEEYEVQHYEGASTLYGPFSGVFIEKELQRIAINKDATPKRTTSKKYAYHPGPHRKFQLQDIGSEPYLLDSGLGNLVQDLESGKPMRNYPQFTWNDILPPWPPKPQQHVTPYVKIQVQKEGKWSDFKIDGVAENDRGIHFVTILLKATGKDSKWGVIWMPTSKMKIDLPLRFCVKKIDGQQVYSRIFSYN
ncbi:neutral ceramidase [Candidatus Uabimicrobium amorphum]|uniref:Neutral ceramidase n=1 Tax=Uabimicrobium amorphum TaxID=2596890 RepID=A0A5S9IT13_UABAM|nr:neutral/alkaline non-lysosomal ceramidase N-terminal domain-containing protein [Candidatus Uabimicrobium amorphum]BBM87207.1 neutral ceramidase [Candidatus Uabimicrobium amorphum]